MTKEVHESKLVLDMPEAPKKRRERGVFTRSDWWLGFGIYVVNLVVHLILLGFPPAVFFYNLDELDLTFSCLDRFLGVPSTIMMEPSSVLQMLSVPVFLVDFILRRGIPFGQSRALNSFSTYLADAYADPRHHVILLRAVVGTIACIGPLLLFVMCRKLSIGRVPSLLIAIALCMHPAFFGQSLLAAGDSPGLAAVLGACFALLYQDTRRALVIAGFLFAMAVAFKITMAGSLIMLLAIIFTYPEIPNPRRALKSLARISLGIVAGILFWWPYVWVEPLRSAKSIIGNLNKEGSHFDGFQFFEKLQESAGTAFLVFAIALLIVSLWRWRYSPSSRLILALMCSFVVMSVPLAMRATSVYPRYFIPLALAPLLCFAAITRESPRFATVALTLLVLMMAVTLIQRQTTVRRPNDLVNALKMIPKLPSDIKTLYLPEEAAVTYAFRLPQSTYARISAHTKEELYRGQGIARFMRERRLPERAIRTLVTDFNEDEQANAAHTAVAAQSDSPSGADVFLYRTEGSDRTSWTDLDLQMVEQLLRGNSAAVLAKPSGVRFGQTFWQGTQWTWYIHDTWSNRTE